MICPMCGGIAFQRTYRISGRWVEWVQFDSAGSEISRESNTDEVIMSKPSKMMICDRCGKQVPNPACDEPEKTP